MGKFIDLTGQRFGKLVAVKRVENDKHNKAQFLCKCDCGNEVVLEATVLRKNKQKSCGCININDISGKRFGKIVVIKPVEERVAKRVCFLCRCDCGEEEIIVGKYLINGSITSCKKCRSPKLKADLSGQKFGEWTVIDYAGNGKWNCVCSCGTRKIVKGWTLTNGISNSCGCMQAKRNVERAKHGKTKSRLWCVWYGMKQRCYDKNHTSYKNYGGRGITVCDEWRNDFQVFYDWAYANGYDENAPKGECTIDRIDNNKGYAPDNCRWITIKEQANNKQQSVWVEVNGESKTLKTWCDIYKIDYRVVVGRLSRGWQAVKALETPLLRQNKK